MNLFPGAEHPMFTDAGKHSKRSWPFLFIRLLGSLMLVSKFRLRDLDNYGNSIFFSLFLDLWSFR
jgi:hypothetical protein